jgi:hypothetical protein
MSLRDLAEAAGIYPQTLANSMARGLPSPRCRLAVENFFGLPIFSSAPEFTRRQELIRLFGEDPNLISFRRLYRRAVGARIRGRAVAKHKAQLIELLAAHLSSAVPSPTPSLPPTTSPAQPIA